MYYKMAPFVMISFGDGAFFDWDLYRQDRLWRVVLCLEVMIFYVSKLF